MQRMKSFNLNPQEAPRTTYVYSEKYFQHNHYSLTATDTPDLVIVEFIIWTCLPSLSLLKLEENTNKNVYTAPIL
jgi:hypothetical protein